MRLCAARGRVSRGCTSRWCPSLGGRGPAVAAVLHPTAEHRAGAASADWSEVVVACRWPGKPGSRTIGSRRRAARAAASSRARSPAGEAPGCACKAGRGPARLARPIARPSTRTPARRGRTAPGHSAAASTASRRSASRRPLLCAAAAAAPAGRATAAASLPIVAEAAYQLLKLVEAGLQRQRARHGGRGGALLPLGRVVGVHLPGRRGQAQEGAGGCTPPAVPTVPRRFRGPLRRGGVARTATAAAGQGRR